MTIHRVAKRGKPVVQSTSTSNNRAPGAVPGEVFAQQLAAQQRVEVAGGMAAEPVIQVKNVAFDPNATPPDSGQYHQQEQLEKTGELLNTLAALGKDLTQSLVESGSADVVRERLREARDNALRTLSDAPDKGEERELLHRTTVLATVELAKTDRGDYK